MTFDDTTFSTEELAEIERRRAEARTRARTLAEMSDAEDAAITAAAVADPDARPLTDAERAELRPSHEVLPGLVKAARRRQPGRPKAEKTKARLTMRVDQDVIDHFKSTGKGWQGRINEALRKAAGFVAEK